MQKYNNIVSLGYICNINALKNHLKGESHSMVFDNIATPMWAINELVISDFKDFMLEENIQKKKLFTDSDEEFWIDSKYYTRFLFLGNHERFKKSIQKRITNFKNTFNQSDPILFIRYEEPIMYDDRGERIIFPEYKNKYEKSELEYLKELSKHIKSTYPQLNFKILFLSSSDNFIDEENKIIGVKAEGHDYRNKHIGKNMAKILDEHKEFLDTNL